MDEPKCGRTACDAAATSGPHVHSGKHYCEVCRRLINRANGQELVPEIGKVGDGTLRPLKPGGFWEGLKAHMAGRDRS